MYIEDFTFAEEGWKILYRWRGKDEGEEIDIQHEVQCTVSGYLCYSPLLRLCVCGVCVCLGFLWIGVFVDCAFLYRSALTFFGSLFSFL